MSTSSRPRRGTIVHMYMYIEGLVRIRIFVPGPTVQRPKEEVVSITSSMLPRPLPPPPTCVSGVGGKSTRPSRSVAEPTSSMLRCRLVPPVLRLLLLPPLP